MITKQRPNLSIDLTEALKAQKPFAQKGASNAVDAVNMLEATVTTASDELQAEIDRLEHSNIRDDTVSQTLASQLEKIKQDYSILPMKLRDKIDTLSRSDFTITVFGKTTSGKSTLMEILTRGDGLSIGMGGQRTTRNVRRYKYKKLQLVDVPGIAAFGGQDDTDIAFCEAEKSDLILFLMKDDDIQVEVADCLNRIISLGKPVICLLNVQVGLGDANVNKAKYELSPRVMKVFRKDLDKKMSQAHLDGLKKQFFEYGRSYGDNWNKIRFAYVHLKAAYLAQQKECEEYATELYELSRFNYLDQLIIEEITQNGGFYKLKAYTEVVSVPLADSVEMLYEQSAQNSRQGSLMLAKRRALSEWISQFRKNAETEIETFLTDISSDLKKEVASFAESNYDNKNASKQWNEVVKKKGIQERSQKVLLQLGQECENELKEITRETEFDIRFDYKLSSEKSLNMRALVNGRRIWNWATAIVSGGLSIAGLFVAAPMTIAGVAVGLAGWLGNLLFSDYESKAKNARKELERKLINHINRQINGLRRSMRTVLYGELLNKYMNPMERSMNEIIASLFALSDVQHGFAKRLCGKLKEINKLLISEALIYEGFSGLEYHVNEVARISGKGAMIVLDDGKRFPNEARTALQRILKEEILFVFQKDSIRSMLCQAIGKGCERSDIRVQDIKGRPRIAHISSLEKADEYTKNRIRMAQQLTGLLIMQ